MSGMPTEDRDYARAMGSDSPLEIDESRLE